MMSNLDEMYHVCRWCKWYEGGKCTNAAFSKEIDTSGVYQVAEDGRLSGTIEETLNSISIAKIERELKDKLEEFKLSGKRIDEVLQVLRECIPEFLDFECKPKLDEAISGLYQEDADNNAESSEGVEISDPTTFYCKEFW